MGRTFGLTRRCSSMCRRLEKWFAWLCCEWLVEEVDYGGSGAEAVEDGLEEGGLSGVLSGEPGADTPLAATDEVVSRVFLAEALGRPGERETFGSFPLDGERTAEPGGAGERAELPVVLGEVATDGEELLALGHVDTGGDDELGAGEVEVEAGSGGLVEAFARPPGGDVVFVGALVRTEAGVAIDAHHGLRGRPDMLGGEAEHGFVELGDEGQQWLFAVALEEGFALVEPVAIVVALEGAKKFEGGGGEVRGIPLPLG